MAASMATTTITTTLVARRRAPMWRRSRSGLRQRSAASKRQSCALRWLSFDTRRCAFPNAHPPGSCHVPWCISPLVQRPCTGTRARPTAPSPHARAARQVRQRAQRAEAQERLLLLRLRLAAIDEERSEIMEQLQVTNAASLRAGRKKRLTAGAPALAAVSERGRSAWFTSWRPSRTFSAWSRQRSQRSRGDIHVAGDAQAQAPAEQQQEEGGAAAPTAAAIAAAPAFAHQQVGTGRTSPQVSGTV